MSEPAERNLRIESWPIEHVQPYEKNAKNHDAEQVRKIAASIREFGWDQPIAVDRDGVVIKGHGRRLAAIELGMRKVPVIVRYDLSPEQVRAARLADNRVAQSDYDTQLIHEELKALEASDPEFDFGVMGFDARELEFLTAELDDVADESIMEDLNREVDAANAGLEAKAEQVKEREVAVTEALGFKQVTQDQAKQLNRFMAQLEKESGLAGREAFMGLVAQMVEGEVA